MDPETPRIARDELFRRLESGEAGGIAVVTPNHRLAQALMSQFDRRQQGAGHASWEAPDILHWTLWIERLHEDARYSPAAADVPLLLSPSEEQLLWEEAIRASPWKDELLSVPATASLAADAWKAAHAWRIDSALDGWPGNEDADAFRAWRHLYMRRTAKDGLIDGARLPAWAGNRISQPDAARPRLLVLYAFDLLTPQQQDFLVACRAASIEVALCGPVPCQGRRRRTMLDDPRIELEHAARWARSKLEQAAGQPVRIGVVVPDLTVRRGQVARIFGRWLPPSVYNLSAGEPLSATPLVDAALAILELTAGPVAFDRASRVLRSPFIAGAAKEQAQRAGLDAVVRRNAPATLSAMRLRTLVAQASGRGVDCPELAALLDRLIDASRDSQRALPHAWARRFTATLVAAGFPGERALDSNEFQTLEKWREAVANLARLDTVAAPWSAGEARSRLARLCSDTLFQPASGGAPVQILGVLESARLEFDHLWVSGLTDEAWPVAARPQPLLPVALQCKAGLPQASAERSLEVDRAFTQAWCEAAPEVVFSSARAEGDRELLASPLVAAIALTPVDDLGIPGYATLSRALFEAGRAMPAKLRADAAVPLEAGAVCRGGTAVLADQAACAFRAFAHFRLGAQSLERPEPGLTPAERGQLLHGMMARLWGELKDQRTLLAASPEALDEIIQRSVVDAMARFRSDRAGRLEGRLAELERARLAAVALEWLALERQRPPFEVVQREEKRELSAGALQMRGRVDRVDRLQDGGLAVIDYKTGPASVGEWLGARPDDLQLPLYALAPGEEAVRAVAFARLRKGELAFAGLAREAGMLSGTCPPQEHRTARRMVASWDELVASWRAAVARLGDEFVAGEARIAPKRALATCDRCDLKPLCRVHERIAIAVDIEEDEAE